MKRLVLAGLAGMLLGCGTTDPSDPANCDANGTVDMATAPDSLHVVAGTNVTYTTNPPAIGRHWNTPAANGYHGTLVRPEEYLENAARGAIVFLHRCPSGCIEQIDAMRAFAAGRAGDAGGPFRYVITEAEDPMPTRLAVVAWGWIYRADCFESAEVEAFITLHYRQGPEDAPTP